MFRVRVSVSVRVRVRVRAGVSEPRWAGIIDHTQVSANEN